MTISLWSYATRCAGFLSVALLLLGCRHTDLPENMPTLYPTSVKVTQEGEPLEGAFVRLFPEASMPWSCGGTTDESGIAKLKVSGQYDGVPAGDYKVLVSKVDQGAGAQTDALALTEPRDSSPAYDLVDPKFGSSKESTLRLSVSSTNETFDFDVGKEVRVLRSGPPLP